MFFTDKRFLSLLIWSLLFINGLSSCNKEFEDIPTITDNGGTTAGELIETDPNFSTLKAAVVKAGLLDLLKTKGASYTILAPDNTAFTASQISPDVINALPANQLQALLSYHIIPQALPSAKISAGFPNVQMPTLLPLLASNPFTKMSIFVGKQGTSLFVNNVSVTEADMAVANGVVHKVARVVAPPTQLVAQVTAADADLSFFRAAVARADSGQVGLNRLDSVMKFGLANVTVFAPSNDAVKQLLVYMGLPPTEAAFDYIAVPTVRGLVAYHMLGVRAFSVNLPATTSTIQTLLGASPYPPLTIDRTTALPRLTGPGNGGMYANFLYTDRNAVNGVVHKIDMVLLPQ